MWTEWDDAWIAVVNGLAYHGELGEVVGGGRCAAADARDLGARLVLPRRVGGEQHDGPGEEQRRRLVPGEEERLALVDHHLGVVPQLAVVLVLLHLGQQHTEEPHAARRRRRPALVGDLAAALDGLLEQLLQLPVQPLYFPPVFAW